jgi:hypothetical protein
MIDSTTWSRTPSTPLGRTPAGISPTVHALNAQQLWNITDELLNERRTSDRLKIVWHTDSSLTFEQLPHF